MSIQDEIARIEREAAEKIQALREKAASGIAKQLAEAKEALKEAQKEVERLAAEYAAATGKTIKGEKVAQKGSRVRLTAADKAKLESDVLQIVQGAKEGVSFGDIKKELAGFSDSAIRAAAKGLIAKKNAKMVGERANAVYVAAGKK